jgi:hypothetical protein
MMQDIKAHPFHYAILAMWFSLGVILLSLARYNRELQIQTLMFVTIGYIAWGAIHHYILHTLCAKIMLEYVLFAILSILLFWGVVVRV